VELEAEGAHDELHAFLQAIQHEMVGYIRDTELAEGDRPPQFKGFTIE
jgi:hypothetical protein